MKKDIKKSGLPVLQKITQVYLWVMLSAFLVLPCIIGGYGAVTTVAYHFFTAASCIYLAGLVLIALELVLIGGGSFKELVSPLGKISVSRVCFLLFIVWCLLSAVLSDIDGVFIGLGRYEGLATTILYILIFFAVSSYGRPDGRMLYAVGAVVAVNALLALLQYAGFNPLGLFPDGVDFHDAFVLYSGRFMGTLGNVDVLSAFLCLALPLFYGVYVLTGRKLALPAAALAAFTLALADVDSGYLGIFGMLLLTVPVFYCRRGRLPRGSAALGAVLFGLGMGKMLFAARDVPLRLSITPVSLGFLLLGAALLALGLLLPRRMEAPARTENPRRRAKGLCALVLALCIAGAGAVYFVPFSSGAAGEMHQMMHGNFDPSFGSGRVRIWKAVIDLIAEKPLFGGGPDTLIERMPFTFTRESEEAGTIEAEIDTAHNDYLNIAVNLGVPALLFYLAAVGSLIWRTLRWGSGRGRLVLLPALAAYLIQIFFTFSVCLVSVSFWIILALCESNIINNKTKMEEEL